MDEDRYQVTLGHHAPALGELDDDLSIYHSERENTKGFLREDFDQPPDVANADGFRQTIDENGLYFDTHYGRQFGERVRSSPVSTSCLAKGR